MSNNSEKLSEALKLHKKGKLNEAIKNYNELLKNNKKSSQINFYLGTAYIQKQDYEKAYDYLKQAINIDGDIPNYYNNIGISLSRLNKDREAIANYKKALDLKENYNDAIINIGISYKNLKEFEKSKYFFTKSLEILPNNPIVLNNLGNLYREIGDISKATKAYEDATRQNKDYFEAYNNKAEIFLMQKKFDEAIKEFEKVININPESDYSYGKFIHTKMNLCDWKDFDKNLRKIKDGINNNKKIIEPFPMLSLIDDPKIQKKNSFIYKSFKFEKEKITKNKTLQHGRKKIKVGYFGAEFYHHPVLLMTRDIFKYHNRSKFEVYGFFHGPVKDHLHFEIQKNFDGFYDICHMTTEKILELCDKIGIDIAINFTGYTADSRNEIYVNRVAPIQISFLGFSSTMSAEFMDYIVADKFLIPEDHFENYSEKVIHLPNSFYPSPDVIKISSKNFTKKSLNLPEDSFIFGSFNNNYKITPKIFKAWMEILNNTKQSIIWLLSTNKTAIKNLKRETKAHGVDPKRLIFAEKLDNSEHLKRFGFMDLFLDTFPYNAHSTAVEAIRCEVPILTISGKSFVSRVAGSLLSSIDAKNLICKDYSDYINKAVLYRNNKSEFLKLKDKFKKNNTKILFNSKNYTMSLEKVYMDLLE